MNFDSNRETGSIGIVVLGDADHSSFDNMTFASTTALLLTEDRGDTLHDQLNKLDSIWAFDVRFPNKPARFVALGQDRMAVDEDSEPTGLHYSDGDSSVKGLLGRQVPNVHDGRLFFTQQHGENNLFEAVTQGSDKPTGE